MKKTLLLSVFAFAVLAGCGNSATVDNGTGTINTGTAFTDTNKGATASGDTKTVPTEFRFGIDTCDQYTKLMECVIDKIPAASRSETIDQYENVIKMWKQFSGSDLKSVCDQTITALQDTKESFNKIGCNL